MYGLQWFVLEGLRKNQKGIYNKYNTIFLKQNNYNTIMMGSSRMFMHLDNNLFDSLCHTQSYNIGLPGATTRMTFACLKGYLNYSSAPKTAFLELDYHISHLTTDTVYNFSTYIPYLSNQSFYKQLKSIDRRFSQFKYNPFVTLPYLGISSLSASLNGWFHRPGYYDNYFEQGFFKNELMDDYNHVGAYNKFGVISSETSSYLDSIVYLCKQNKTQLIFTISPAYKNAGISIPTHKNVIQQFKQIAQQYQLPVLDYSKDTSICNQKKYFEDNYHMFYSGARLYTQKIAQDFNNKAP
jgi:hypothetical protein